MKPESEPNNDVKNILVSFSMLHCYSAMTKECFFHLPHMFISCLLSLVIMFCVS